MVKSFISEEDFSCFAVYKNSNYFAHCGESILTHAENTRLFVNKLCKKFKIYSLNLDEEFYNAVNLIAFYHDLGKSKNEFQISLKKICEGKKSILPTHSYVGWFEFMENLYNKYINDDVNKEALESDQNLKRTIEYVSFLSQIIEWHHTELKEIHQKQNGIGRNESEEWQKLYRIKNLIGAISESQFGRGDKDAYFYFFLFRLAYSLVVTADRLASYFGNRFPEYLERRTFNYIQYKENLEKYVKELKNKNEVSQMREYLRQYALAKINKILEANDNKRIFYLFLPTGAGKTLTSISLALEIANIKKLDRIIYVSPYLSIIEQNTAVMKQIFEDDLFAIHSHEPAMLAIKENSDEDLDFSHTSRILLLDNSAVAISTVRFFDILFSNKKDDVIKTLSLTNSVVILDEVQYFPKEYWKGLARVLSTLSQKFNTYFILMSATLPRLDEFLDENERQMFETIISEDTKFIDKKYRNLFEKFKSKIEIKRIKSIEKNNLKEIEDILNETQYKRALIVVNTVKKSKEIYKILNDSLKDSKILLLNSTILFPRKLEVIEEFNKQNNKKMILVSTQSVEAGVDIDADIGFREFAPYESLLQVAGRVNRHLLRQRGTLYIASQSNGKIYKDEFNTLGYNHIEGLIAKINCKTVDLFDFDSLKKYFNYSTRIIKDKRTKSDKYLLPEITYFNFSLVANNKLIVEKGQEYCFEGFIPLKDEYRLTDSLRIKLLSKVSTVFSNVDKCFSKPMGFSQCLIQKDKYTYLDTGLFAEKYNEAINELKNLNYEERLNTYLYFKDIDFVWNLFTFNSFEDIKSWKEEYNRKWVNENGYDYVSGVKESTIEETVI